MCKINQNKAVLEVLEINKSYQGESPEKFEEIHPENGKGSDCFV